MTVEGKSLPRWELERCRLRVRRSGQAASKCPSAFQAERGGWSPTPALKPSLATVTASAELCVGAFKAPGTDGASRERSRVSLAGQQRLLVTGRGDASEGRRENAWKPRAATREPCRALWSDQKSTTSAAESVLAFVTPEEIRTEIRSSKEESSSVSHSSKESAFSAFNKSIPRRLNELSCKRTIPLSLVRTCFFIKLVSPCL